MRNSQLNILGGCTLVVPESGVDLRGVREINLLENEVLRSDDLALLALLGTNQSCSRLRCIRFLWPEYVTLTECVEKAKPLRPEQEDQLQKVSEDLTRCASRLRKVIKEEAGANVIHSVRRQNLAGSLELDPRYIDIDYRLVREDLVNNRSRQLSRVFGRIKGNVLAGYAHPALTLLRNEVLCALSEWLSNSAFLRLEFSVRERNAIAGELLRSGVSPTYNSMITRVTRNRRTNGHHVLAAGSPDDELAQYAVPEIAPEELTLVARDTFGELLKSWLTGEEEVATPGPATVYADISARWDAIDSIPFKVDVLVCEEAPQHVEVDGATYLVAPIGADRVRALRAAVRSSPPSYLAFAVPSRPGVRREEVYDVAPPKRFRWWLMGAQRYFASPIADRQSDRILFPEQNMWNLSMCSLVWASRWVERFYWPLLKPEVQSHPILTKQIAAVFTDEPDYDQALAMGWDHLVKDLPSASPNMDDDVFRNVSLSLGLGSALQLICAQLRDPKLGKQTQIRTYTPEALFGTICMWLFSRSYHQFMALSGDKGVGGDLEINQRLMPIIGDDPIYSSRLHRAALWNVMLLYRMCGVAVRIIPEPEEANSDRAYYGNDIGHFQWMSFDTAGGQWLIDQTKRDVQEGYREFFHEKERQALFDGRISEEDYANASALDPEALTLDPRKPRWLLPQEDGFIEHPWLWQDNCGAAARLRQARHRGA